MSIHRRTMGHMPFAPGRPALAAESAAPRRPPLLTQFSPRCVLYAGIAALLFAALDLTTNYLNRAHAVYHLTDRPLWLMFATGLLILVAAGTMARRHAWVALALIAGGALGNATEIATVGAVRDWVHVPIGTMNIADVGMLVGLLMLVAILAPGRAGVRTTWRVIRLGLLFSSVLMAWLIGVALITFNDGGTAHSGTRAPIGGAARSDGS